MVKNYRKELIARLKDISPLTVDGGEIIDKLGVTILKVNRDGHCPLIPVERDELITVIHELLTDYIKRS